MFKIVSIVAAIVLFVSGATFTPVYAQSMQDDSYQNSQTDGSSGNVSGTTDTRDNNGFNPLWLLPLLAIPLLFFMRRSDNNDDNNYRHSSGLAGTKGGGSYRRSDNKTDEEL